MDLGDQLQDLTQRRKDIATRLRFSSHVSSLDELGQFFEHNAE